MLDVFFAGSYDLRWGDRKMKKEFEVVSQETFKYLHVFLVNLASRTPHIHKEIELGLVLKGKLTVREGKNAWSLDRDEIDLRYLEQIVDESQTAALAYIMQYILGRLANGKKSAAVLAMEAAEKLEKDGILSVTPKNYGAGPAAKVRVQEILACLSRYRLL